MTANDKDNRVKFNFGNVDDFMNGNFASFSNSHITNTIDRNMLQLNISTQTFFISDEGHDEFLHTAINNKVLKSVITILNFVGRKIRG